MKKTYMKPSMLAITLQHQNHLMQNISSIETNKGIENGGDGNHLGADVKGSKSIWDEEW